MPCSYQGVKGLAKVGFLSGILWAAPSIGLTQQELPDPPMTASSAPPSEPAASGWDDGSSPPVANGLIQVQGSTAVSPTLSLGATPQASAEPPAEAPSIWSKVPPVEPTPRPGWFLVPPTSPGYYSAKDLLTGTEREKPPIFPYRGTCFDNDFRYLDKPDNKQTDLFDPLKRIHLGDNFLLSLGGEERVRYMSEVNGYVRLTGVENDYTLIRSRLYADLWYKDRIRIYAEYIDAQIDGEDLTPLPIDVNHSDFLNLFADVKVAELADNPVYVRAGRQEMLYGSQRLISPLEWANTKRTFQGVKGFWHSDKLDVDAFWVQPIIINPTHFDSPDDGQQFAGVWTTYRPYKGQVLDLYYLYLENTRPVATGSLGAVGGFNVNTLGSRYAGDYHHFLYDVEGMYQFGDFANQGISAGAFTAGLGYQFADVPMNPQFWIYNDWASGNHHPGVGNEHGTFNQLFPFGHYYFGYLDLVGRQNIDDLNMQFAFYPTRWITSGIQYHIFRLDSAKDSLYNASGVAIRTDPTGLAGTDVGDEIDVFTNFHLSQHQDLLVGYSKLYAGDFIKRTGDTGSPELFYVQYSFKW